MKRPIVSFLALSVAFAVPVGTLLAPRAAMAQQRRFGGLFGGGGQLSVIRLPEGLQTRLMLTADQKQKIAAIQEKMQGQMRDLRQNGGDAQAARQQMTALMEKSDAEAVAVLTADQKKTYDGWKAQSGDTQGLGRGSIALISVSGLTGDQKGKLKTLSTEMGKKRMEMLQGLQGGGDFQAIREKMTALEEETTSAVKKVLNADQGKEYDTALAEIPAGGRRRN